MSCLCGNTMKMLSLSIHYLSFPLSKTLRMFLAGRLPCGLQLWLIHTGSWRLSGSCSRVLNPSHWVPCPGTENVILSLVIRKTLASSCKPASLVRLCLLLKPQGLFLIIAVTTVWVALCNNYPDVWKALRKSLEEGAQLHCRRIQRYMLANLQHLEIYLS